MKDLKIFPEYHNPPRMPRFSKQTMKELEMAFEHDENMFWDGLAIHHDSLTGHIRRLMKLSRTRIKNCHKLLINNRSAQAVFNKWITGDLFKTYINNQPAIPECNICPGIERSLEHFINCSGYNLLLDEDALDYEQWSKVCIKYAKILFPQNNIT